FNLKALLPGQMWQQAAACADIEQRFSARILLYEIQILLHLLMNRGLEATVIKLHVAAPAIEVLRVVILRARVLIGPDGRQDVIALVAFVDLLAREVFTHAAQRTFAKKAYRGRDV